MYDKCIMCGNPHLKYYEAEYVPFLKERMFENKDTETKLAYCPDCGMYYASYRPTDKEMELLYKNYRDEKHLKQRQKYEPDYTAEFNKKLGYSEINKAIKNNHMQSLLSKYADKNKIKTVLDYGGDSGQNIPSFFTESENFVYDISAVKPVEGVKAVSREELHNKKWDFIMCNHVLEHVSYPLNIINEIIDILAEDGLLYLEVPNDIPYINSFLNKTKKQKVLIHEHMNFFTAKSLYKIFNRDDFIILDNGIVKQDSEDSGEIEVLRILARKTQKSNQNIILNRLYNIESLYETLTAQNEKLLTEIQKERLSDKLFSEKITEDRKILKILGIKISRKLKKS